MKFNLLFALIISVLLFSTVSAADPGHSAASIGAGTFEAGNFVFQNNLTVGGNNLFVNNGTGNVGIGLFNPTAKLFVNGTTIIQPLGSSDVGLTVNTANAINAIRTFGANNPRVAIGAGTDNNLNTLQIFGTTAAIGNITITGWLTNLSLPLVSTDAATKAYVDTAVAGANSSLSAADDWNLSSNVLYPKDLLYNISIGGTTAAYKLEISSMNRALNVSGNFYVNNTNVGIGTANPLYNLQVQSPTPTSVISQRGNNSANQGLIQYYDLGPYWELNNPAGDLRLANSWDSTKELQFSANAGTNTFASINAGTNFTGGLRLTAGGSGIVINGTGSVGIGTFTPRYKLEVNALSNALNVSNNLYVNSTHVGIGTANPTTTLDVNGIVNASGFLVNGTPISTSTNGTATYVPYTGANQNVNLGNMNLTTSKINLNTAGGGGNMTDFIRLVPANGLNTDNTTSRISSYSDVLNGYIDFKRFTSGGPTTGIILGTFSGDLLTLKSTGSSDLGRIGIGITSPTAKLHVNGTFLVANDTGVIGLSQNANSFVGIGTSTPSMALDVRGTGNFSGTIYINNGTDVSSLGSSTYINTVVSGNYTNATNYANTLNNSLASFIASNLSSSFVPYVGASKNTILGNNNLSIGPGRTNVKATLDINGSLSAIFSSSGTYTIGQGSHAIGYVSNSGSISSTGSGSLAQGSSSQGTLTSSGVGSLAQGSVASSGSVISSTGSGSLARGFVNGGAMIVAIGVGSLAQGSTNSPVGNISATGSGSVAQGYSLFSNISAIGDGSFAGGYTSSGNVVASGKGSFVWGNDSSSSGDHGIVFGTGIANTLGSSFAVGFGNTGTIPRLFVNGSAVGIGTTTPTRTLDVNGIVNASDYLINGTSISAALAGASTTYVNTVVSGNYSNGTAYTNTVNNSLASYIAANETATYVPYVGASKNTILGNYNLTIGLGRTTPKATLDINGSLAAISYLGSGNYSLGKNSFILGTLGDLGNISSSGIGSIASGYASVGIINASNTGSFAQGSSFSDDGTPTRLVSSGHGAFAQGVAYNGNVVSSGFGSSAQGYAFYADIFSSGIGSSAGGGTYLGEINSSGDGAFAFGYSNGKIRSSGTGSVAIGSSQLGGNITSSGTGSVAIGAAHGGNINSLGTGSFVWGNGTQSAGNYSFVLGTGLTNNINNAFIVGFGNTGTIPRLFVNGSAVGIGTTTPTSTLDVNGIVNASGYLINGTPISSSGNITSTYVPYVGANQNVNLGGNNFTVDTSLLQVDATNDRVGIGTANPLTKFEVAASSGPGVYDARVSRAGNQVVYTGISAPGGTNTQAVIGVSGAGALAIQGNGGVGIGGNYGNGTNGSLPSNGLAVEGSLGIGTTTPSRALDVRGVGNFSGTVYINNNTDILTNLTVLNNFWNSNSTIFSAINAAANSTNGSATYVPYTGATKNLILGTSNLTIGRGRTTPAATLDINGSFAAINYPGTGVYNIGANSFILGSVSNGGNLTSIGTGSFALGYSGATGSITSLAAGSLAGGSTEVGSNVNLSIISSNVGSFSWGWVGGLGANNVSIISSGQASFAQGGVSGSSSRIVSTGFGSFAQGAIASGGNISSSGSGSFAQGAVTFGNLVSSGQGSFAGGAALGGNITSSGVGSFVFGNASSSTGNFGTVFGTGIANTIANSFSVGYGNVGSIPRLFVNGSAVGIGTTTPTQALDVNGIVNASGFLVNGTPISTSGNITGTYVPYSGALNNVNLGSWNLTTTGQVGIGTTTPAHTLEVKGTFNASNSNGGARLTSGGDFVIGI